MVRRSTCIRTAKPGASGDLPKSHAQMMTGLVSTVSTTGSSATFRAGLSCSREPARSKAIARTYGVAALSQRLFARNPSSMASMAALPIPRPQTAPAKSLSSQ